MEESNRVPDKIQSGQTQRQHFYGLLKMFKPAIHTWRHSEMLCDEMKPHTRAAVCCSQSSF